MKINKNIKEVYLGLGGLIGLILLIILASSITPGSVFQGRTTLNPAASTCSSLALKSIPSPVEAGRSAVIVVQTEPADWSGTLRYSASAGILLDGVGNEGSLIETEEKIVDYSGGESGDVITVQAAGSGNETCLATVTIKERSVNRCATLEITSDPSPLPADQSARLTVTVVPEDFAGEIVVRADSGTIQSASDGKDARGENTSLMVTTGRNFYYGGGKRGEKIHVDALGENNSACKDVLEIGA
jgi:hypothetical protein